MKRMAALGWEAWGIEMDPRAAANAAKGVGAAERVFVGRALDADYPPESFDAVVGSHVVEHLHDPLELLRRARGWLRAGGELRLWAPNIASLESRVFGAHWSALDVPRHLHHFTPTTLGAVLAEAGFEVSASRPQFQGSSFADSLVAAVVRRGFSPASGLLYSATVPIGWLLCAAGSGAYVEVRARPV
jgi:SAM-dependent methyltransferase